ncbi:YncE family protein, partial [Phaeovulum sp.]|uniref:YncE family protein n=1 Tax=Phaeovulum sp. TaxID=2934796 RepID=UPI0035652EB5
MKLRLSTMALLAGASMMAMTTTATAGAMDIPGYEAAVAAAAAADWANAESDRGGLFLVAQFDSSGPDAWDPIAHPLVYATSESHANPNPNRTLPGGFAGFQLIDAMTKESIYGFIAAETEKTSGMRGAPHGVALSPDGAWAYLGWSETDDSVTGYTSYVAVVNVRTMKIDKLIKQESRFRGAPRAQRLHHIQSWTDIDGNDNVVLQWGFGADGGPHHILDPNDNNRVKRSITYEDVQVMGHPFTTPSNDGKTLYVSIGSPEIREADSHHAAGMAKVNLDTGAVTNIMGFGNHPIGVTHSADGKFTYVVDGHGSHVYKLDDETNEIVGSTSAGVAGPYGLCMNWDESLMFVDGKGEGSHNIGSVLGVIDLKTFSPARAGFFQQPIFLGGSANSVDHCILHPDPAVNEIWVSN